MLVPMPMMDVGKVGVPVSERDVGMRMGVWLAGGIVRPMLVPMVFVVYVPVAVVHRFVRMLVFVALREMQPKPDRHQCRGGEEERRHWIAPEKQAARGTDEGREREVSACAGGAE